MPLAVSVTVKPPFTTPAVPLVVGVKVTLNVQLAAEFKVLPQGFEPLAIAAKFPPAAHDIFCAVAALLVTVTVCGLLVFPTVVAGKVKVAGETAIVICAEPESAMRCGAPFTPLSLIVTIPGIVPTTVGAKLTLMLHDAPAASGLLLTQVSVSR
jgi:hypothetical protein